MSYLLLISLILAFVGKSVYAQSDSLKLGTFTVSPTTSTPSPQPDIECQAGPPTELEASLPNRPYSGNRGIAFGEIYQQLTGHGMNQRTTTQELEESDRLLEEYHAASAQIFGNNAYYYTKGYERFGFRQGFVISQRQELRDTFLPLSCLERISLVAAYLPTPLYFHPTHDQPLTFKLNDQEFRLFVRKNGEFRLDQDDQWFSSLHYNLSSLSLARGNSGWVIAGSKLPTFLRNLAQRLSFNALETQDFLDYWQQILPAAAYYRIIYLPAEEALRLAPWTIEPKPDYEYRHYLIFEPAMVSPQPFSSLPVLPKVRFGQMTVVDWGGVVLY